ncbi:LysR family transcriptional regulator [Cribrihabitans pelagius]|uniref:LysR family transcriptional regulator n=1 Tax=Cribrihabitans pelagius TaxID=1765746 RepID=UPI003B5C6CE4
MSRLETIETFAEVASQLSFAKAARRLRLPPSTVTTRVRALEDSLGVRLLTRTTRSVALTPEGAVFLERCRIALDEIEAARSLVSAGGSARGPVRVSIPTAFPMAQFAALSRRFLARHPEISLDIAVSDQPADFVADGIDVALRGNRPGGPGLIARELLRTPVVLAAPPGRLEDPALPVLGPLAGPLQQPLRPGSVRCESFDLTLQLVLEGLARACLPLQVCETDVRRGALDCGPAPEGATQSLALYLVYQDRRHQPQRVRLFINHLVEELARRPAAGPQAEFFPD